VATRPARRVRVAPHTGRADRNVISMRVKGWSGRVAPHTGRADRNFLIARCLPVPLNVAPHTGRADRNIAITIVVITRRPSRPTRGARIETPLLCCLSWFPLVAPHTGRADRNCSDCRAGYWSEQVAPHTGRADRNVDYLQLLRPDQVAPHTGRADRNGQPDEDVSCGPESRPTRGARIETVLDAYNNVNHAVAPHTGRADRNEGASFPTQASLVAPHTGRADRNCLTSCASSYSSCRAPHGARG